MSKKYTVQNVGRPYGPTETISESDWKDLSQHASKDAAFKAIQRYTAHLSQWQWDDHYRVVAPDGTVCDRGEWNEEQNQKAYEKYERKYNPFR